MIGYSLTNKARKEHTCNRCNKQILIGDSYINTHKAISYPTKRVWHVTEKLHIACYKEDLEKIEQRCAHFDSIYYEIQKKLRNKEIPPF